MFYQLRLIVLLSIVFALSLSVIQPTHAQDNGDTPVAVREAAINAHNSVVPGMARPTSWRHTILGLQTNSSLGCGLVTGSDLNSPVNVYQVWLNYEGTEYLYHVSEDGALVQPCDSNLPTSKPVMQQQSNCDTAFTGYMRPRLTLNGEGRVIAGGVPNRVRSEPSLNGEFLFQMEPATSFAIISGPQCNDGIVWWMVQSNAGAGWTAESNVNDNNNYYLEPSDDLSNIPLTAQNITQATRINSRFEYVLRFALDGTGQLLLNNFQSFERYNWNTLNENLEADILMSPAPVYFDVSENGQYITSGSYAESGYAINLWSTLADDNWIPDQVYKFNNERGLMNVAVNNNGIVAIAHGHFGLPDITPGPVMLWDSNTNTELVSLQHNALVTDIAFNADGTLLATSTLGEGTFIWSVPDGILLATLTTNGIPVFSPGGSTLAIGGADGHVSFWSTANFINIGNVQAFAPYDIWASSITAINYSPDGSLLAVGRGLRYVDGGPPEGFTADVKVIEIETNAILATFVGDQSYVNDLAFAPNGTALIVNAIGTLYFLTLQP